MTRSTKLVLPAVLAVAVVAAFWLLILSPEREALAKLDADISAQESAAVQSEQLAVTYAQAKGDYRKNYATVVRLGKAVPADDDVRSLLVQIDDAAKRSKVTFRSLNVTGSGAAKAGTTASPTGLAPAPGTVSVGSAGFSAMPFTFAFSGSFFHLSDFFRRLEHFVTVQNDSIDVTGRLLLMGNIAVTPDNGDLGKLQAQITAATYLVPPPAGVPGAPTPAAAGVGPAATTPGTAGPVVPPTATITGAR